ncbi:hypothetical protein QEZ54_03615 [Catellatospora sp. KI3]|uniref:hypothetical protein n=1 Tax=Catellatospora sp. KI3 TaxID=3041620 RepID=UPI0024831D84|nr:hypothetical protein [Catellatospora sp. KI3]MDI1460046.1 hypothetical protein [Catellatospora sp. KI3]
MVGIRGADRRRWALALGGLVLVGAAWWWGLTWPIAPFSPEEPWTIWPLVLLALVAIGRAVLLRRRRSGAWRQGAADGEPGLAVSLAADLWIALAVYGMQLPIIARYAKTESALEWVVAVLDSLLALGIIAALVVPVRQRRNQIVLNADGVRVHRHHFPWSEVIGVTQDPRSGWRLATVGRVLFLRGTDYGMWDRDMVNVIRFYLEHPQRRGELAHLPTAPAELVSGPGTP